MTPSSLAPCFHQELLAQEQSFLYVALDLYIQLLRLFVEGKDLPQSDPAGQSPDPAEHVSEVWNFFPPLPESYPFSLPPATGSIPPHLPLQGGGRLWAASAGSRLARTLGLREAAGAAVLPWPKT